MKQQPPNFNFELEKLEEELKFDPRQKRKSRSRWDVARTEPDLAAAPENVDETEPAESEINQSETLSMAATRQRWDAPQQLDVFAPLSKHFLMKSLKLKIRIMTMLVLTQI